MNVFTPKELHMKSGKLLGVIIVLQGLILLGQWTGSGYLTSAAAQVPDPANRQMQMIEELRTMNAKMDQVIEILKTGEVQVKVAKPDEAKGAPAKK
jgi:hypothetical protein